MGSLGPLLPVPVPVPLLLLLLLRLLLSPLALAGAEEGPLVFPRLSNVRFSIGQSRCELTVTWEPVQPSGNPCPVLYESDLDTDGDLVLKKWYPQPFRTLLVPLGRKTVFRARAVCSNESEGRGEWVNITLSPNGPAGTGAINISCIWHNYEYIKCSWQRGKNATSDTLYNLTYWCDTCNKKHECTNYVKEGDTFGCSFNFTIDKIEPFAISIHGGSEDIQTVCVVTNTGIENAIPIKLNPPILNISKSDEGVSLRWTPAKSMGGICYEVQMDNTTMENMPLKEISNLPVPLGPKEYHTFRVRAILGKVTCDKKELRGHWSDWSNQVEWDDRDSMFNILPFIFIPLCLTVLMVTLLVYLKRIKLLILPTIPDPGKFLKGMLEDQNEDLHVKGMFNQPIKDLEKYPMELPVKEEPTHLLILKNKNEN